MTRHTPPPIPVHLSPRWTGLPPGVPLSPLERHLAAQLGAPLTTVEEALVHLERAKALLGDLRAAAGFDPDHTSWLTTRNKKMAKGPIASAGLTLHAATSARLSWDATPASLRADYAAILGVTEGEVADLVQITTCSCSTKSCRQGCSVEQSLDSRKLVNLRVRLIRTLLMMADPAAAYALTIERLGSLVRCRGTENVRLRMNISDDLRHEYLCPALLAVGAPAYAYTKHPVGQRPGVDGLTLVYSATERWTFDDIAVHVDAGHRVAVPVDIRFGRPMPTTFGGLPLVDGDLSDDLTVHPPGVLIGLRGRSRDLGERRRMIEQGFIWRVA